jgi:acyl-CoA thioesterase-1
MKHALTKQAPWWLPALLVMTASSHAPAAEPGSFEEKAAAHKWSVRADPALPNVLILGDSISIGYTLEVRKLLEGRANVYRPAKSDGSEPVNCRHSTYSIDYIDEWLAMAPQWAVIHFNWGLHDLVRSKKGDQGLSATRVSLAEYGDALQRLVDKMKATGARLIFATTTTFPPGVSPIRLPEDVEKFNAAAREVMCRNGVEIDDLHAFTKDRLAELQPPVNVHFTEGGSKVIAGKVAECITRALDARNLTTPARTPATHSCHACFPKNGRRIVPGNPASRRHMPDKGGCRDPQVRFAKIAEAVHRAGNKTLFICG